MTKFQFDFIYDAYKAEVDIMHKIDAQAPFYAVTCSAFGGVVAFLLLHSGEVTNVDLRMLVVTCTIVSAIALGFAIYHLTKSYVGQRYRFTPDAVALEAYLRQMSALHPGNDDQTDAACRDDLARQLAQIADFNRAANRNRYGRYNLCAYFLIVSALLWALAGAGFAAFKEQAKLATPAVSAS